MASLGVVASPLARVAATEAVPLSAEQPAASVDRCECGAPADDIHFDRSICACGMAHYYCNQCGTQTEACVDESPAATSWLHRRWTCFREGHKWHLPFHGPNYCERCGRLVEW